MGTEGTSQDEKTFYGILVVTVCQLRIISSAKGFVFCQFVPRDVNLCQGMSEVDSFLEWFFLNYD